MMPPLVALVCPMMAPPGLHDGPSHITAPSFSQGLTNFRKASDAVQCNGLTINCKPVYCRTHYPRYILPLQRPALQWCGRVGKFTEVKWSLVRFKLFQKGWNALRTGFPVELSNLYLKISFACPFSKLSISYSILCVFMMQEWKSTTRSDRVLLRCFLFASLYIFLCISCELKAQHKCLSALCRELESWKSTTGGDRSFLFASALAKFYAKGREGDFEYIQIHQSHDIITMPMLLIHLLFRLYDYTW